MKIGVYGGTFDPPHLGHMESAGAAMDILGLDRLLFIPTLQPPHKELPRDSAPACHRQKMTELMADGMGAEDRVSVLDLELRRQGKSYTVDTLTALRAQYPQDELWLLMGGDMLASFRSWHAYRQILELAGIAAFARHPGEQAGLKAQAESLRQESGRPVRVIPLPRVIDVSSTQVRALLAQGRGKELLWLPVYGYILREGLYGTHADLTRLSDDDLRAVSYSMIRAKRIPHVRGTEETARALARRWGADPELAGRAAILHDCTKYLTLEEQLKLCRKYDILLDSLEEKAVKLLHSKTAAALAREVFGEREEICSAIAWHTTGRPGMSTLEKVLYLADYMEPSRSFDGVESLRQLAWSDLDAAVTLGLEMTVEEMKERGEPLHPNTAKALEWMKG